MEEESGRGVFQILISEMEEMRKIQLSVTQKIRALSQTEAYEKNYRLLSGIPGIGLIVGMTFLAEIEDINRFPSTDDFASHVGLIPSCHDSGENEINGDITSRAKNLLRTLIIESACCAARKDPALQMAYCKLCKRMDPDRAVIRIARKLLNRMYHVLKTGTEYGCGKVN